MTHQSYHTETQPSEKRTPRGIEEAKRQIEIAFKLVDQTRFDYTTVYHHQESYIRSAQRALSSARYTLVQMEQDWQAHEESDSS